MRAVFDKFLLLVIAIAATATTVLYMILTGSAILAALAALGWFWYSAFDGAAWAAVILVLLGLGAALALYFGASTGSHYKGLGGLINRTIDAFIAWLGTLKYFSSPFCVVEDPGSYKIKGYEIRRLIDGHDRADPLAGLEPGDILLRGFDGYVDGKLIAMTSGGKGIAQRFSHAALYLGELSENDRPLVAKDLKTPDADGNWREAAQCEKEAFRNDCEYFQPGRQMLVHAMSKGVFVEDILTFLRCDYVAVLRLKTDENSDRVAVINEVRENALGKIGSSYDFQFDQCKAFHRFSCSEFVYFCYHDANINIGLKPRKHSILGLLTRESITPVDIYESASRNSVLQVVWKSSALSEKTKGVMSGTNT